MIESVIAITIIATCLLIGIRLFTSVLNSSDSLMTFKIKYKVDELYNELKTTNDFENEVYDFEGFSITKQVVNFEGNTKLKDVRYIVETVSDTIAYRYLIMKRDREE